MSKRKKSEKEFWESHGLKYCNSAWEAVGLSHEESELAEMKFQMSRRIKKLRCASGITQAQLSKKMGTSQPRVAALETAAHVSLDSFFQAFRALGVSAAEFGKMFAV